MKKYVLALDEGTTSARAVLVDKNCNVKAVAQYEFTQVYPEPSFVEHLPEEIFAKQQLAIDECLKKANATAEDVYAIGITNQRETTVVWDKSTGKPVYNAIVWQCRRTAKICEELIEKGYGPYINKTTGLKADAYFSGTKIKWILDNVKGAKEKANKGELAFGTIDSYLLYRLTGNHYTDRTNASRTMLYDIINDRWDDKLLDILQIPKSMLPEVKPSGDFYGYADLQGISVPVFALVGDQQSAAFGQGCFNEASTKNTYGTGCFLLCNTGETPVYSEHGLLTTVLAGIKGEPITYALEGSVFIGGAVVQWLRDELKLISSAEESEFCAKSVPDNGGVYVVPAFSGIGAPYWNMEARGLITGITRGTGKNHIVRAALESIAYQVDDLIKAMEKDSGKKISALKVDGGASRNDFLMQFQSDLSRVEIVKRENSEATAMGACFIAGLTSGFFANRDEILQKITQTKVYKPIMEKENAKKLKDRYLCAVKACLGLSE